MTWCSKTTTYAISAVTGGDIARALKLQKIVILQPATDEAV